MADSKSSPAELNYVTANRFYVEISGDIKACFNECSGLGITVKAEKHREGGVNNQQRVVLGQADFSDVTLKRGVTNDFAFWDWVQASLTGGSNGNRRRTVNILTFNQAGETMQSWTLIGAVAISWKAPSLKADGNNVGIEELTLAYEGLKVGSSSASATAKKRDAKGYYG
ncbi:MAG: phage tail protein [Spirulinaceae cyanobacterium]